MILTNEMNSLVSGFGSSQSSEKQGPHDALWRETETETETRGRSAPDTYTRVLFLSRSDFGPAALQIYGGRRRDVFKKVFWLMILEVSLRSN